MPPDPPAAWEIVIPDANLWDNLKLKIIQEPLSSRATLSTSLDSLIIMVHTRFFQDADTKLKYQALKKLHQTDFKSGEVFFQKFKKLTLEADVIDNEGQMVSMIKEAVCKTAKDTIYMQPNVLPNTYNKWKHHILQIDYNYWLN
ncbi:uncharacterized protein ARMOST_10092 [Armillaria ostoyae]|uniref:Retrotransposon gag domain-containing protein n=1 Tax=Armillaria ostoyae TaxID=47428 RepID=A0A284RDE2_ARMOS|nr:uncharacterized protein ARMOST_10092 [Armillaria ostoyae]